MWKVAMAWPVAPPQDCPISVLGLKHSPPLWKPDAELSLGTGFFFLIRRNLSLILGIQWSSLYYCVIRHLASPTSISAPCRKGINLCLQSQKGVCSPLSCVGYWGKPTCHGRLAQTTGTDLAVSLLLSVTKALFQPAPCVLSPPWQFQTCRKCGRSRSVGPYFWWLVSLWPLPYSMWWKFSCRSGSLISSSTLM